MAYRNINKKRSRTMKYILLTDVPTPWREKVFEIAYNHFGEDFHVVYCNSNEDRRLWKFSPGNHAKTFLRSLNIKIGAKERNINMGIVPLLLKVRPNVLIWFSFQPTVILSLIISRIINTKLIVLSDTWLTRDRNISCLQNFGRKIAFKYFSDAFIGASHQTVKMFQHYNSKMDSKKIFYSHLCADNDFFLERLKNMENKKKFDIIFAGRIVKEKNPLFFAKVAILIKNKLGSCKALVIGDGDDNLKKQMFNLMESNAVEYHYAGFIEHDRLPDFYGLAKILLLPTSGDCWGVVINEAMISGLPVITTPMTAAAGELVVNEQSGFVLPLDPDIWASKACDLLENPDAYDSFSTYALISSQTFNFQRAAQGIIDSIEYLNRYCT